VGDDTRDILLESAWFNPASDQRSFAPPGPGDRIGPSLRARRGSPCNAWRERATALILEIAGGQPGPVIEQRLAGTCPSPHRSRFAWPSQSRARYRADRRRGRRHSRTPGHATFGVMAMSSLVAAAERAPRYRDRSRPDRGSGPGLRLRPLPSRRPGGRLKIQAPAKSELPEALLRGSCARVDSRRS
jgi:phenylalanyl-tRNA synthetase beta chain